MEIKLPKESKNFKGYSVEVNLFLIDGSKTIGFFDWSENSWIDTKTDEQIITGEVESWHGLSRRQRKNRDWKVFDDV